MDTSCEPELSNLQELLSYWSDYSHAGVSSITRLASENLNRLARVAERILECDAPLTPIVPLPLLESILDLAAELIAERERRRGPQSNPQNPNRPLLTRLLDQRAQCARTTRLGRRGPPACGVVDLGGPPWLLAAVADDGPVIAAVEVVAYDSRSHVLGLSLPKGNRVRATPRFDGRCSPRGLPFDRTGRYRFAGLHLEEPYHLVLRHGSEVLGEAIVSFSVKSG